MLKHDEMAEGRVMELIAKIIKKDPTFIQVLQNYLNPKKTNKEIVEEMTEQWG